MLRTHVQTATLLTVLALFGGGLRADPPRDNAAPTVLRAARLLDVRTGNVISNPVVLLENGRIAAVGGGLAIPKGARVLDLGGAMLLPGLIDSHTHLGLMQDPGKSDIEGLPASVTGMSTADRALAGAASGREMLVAGFTTVRDLGNAGQNGDVSLREAIRKNWVPGPRMFVATKGLSPIGGQFLNIQPEMQGMITLEYAVITGPEEARKAVRQAHFDKADLIKAYSLDRIAPDELLAIVEESHRLGLKVAAHATREPLIRMAIDAGVDSIEHGYSATEDTLKRMAERKVVLVPTIAPMEFWDRILVLRHHGQTELTNFRARYLEMVKVRTSLVSNATKSGVRIAAGSDIPFSIPGMTRGEASKWVYRAYAGAGMTPLQILQAATINGAELIGPKAQCGALEKGLYADIIAVSSDPLKDITELERVKFVMKEGAVIHNDLK